VSSLRAPTPIRGSERRQCRSSNGNGPITRRQYPLPGTTPHQPPGAVPAPPGGESDRIRWFRWDELPGLDLDPGLVRAFRKARALVDVR
jgi:hypothetical protein